VGGRAGFILDPGIRPHRVVDVLEVLLAKISELDPDLASDLIVGRSREADAARFGDALKPSRDVNAVSKDVMGLDDYVSDIDPTRKAIRLSSASPVVSS